MHPMLRSLLRKHMRLTKTATIGLVLAGLGFGLFYVLVFHLGVDKLKASMLLSPCMTALSLVHNQPRILRAADRLLRPSYSASQRRKRSAAELHLVQAQ
jgi:hypothetical protein